LNILRLPAVEGLRTGRKEMTMKKLIAIMLTVGLFAAVPGSAFAEGRGGGYSGRGGYYGHGGYGAGEIGRAHV
jgi:hypothetical protein